MTEKRNMYGCLSCPKCGSAHRFVLVSSDGSEMRCDDCEFGEPVDKECRKLTGLDGDEDK